MKISRIVVLLLLVSLFSCTKEVLKTKKTYTENAISGKVGILNVCIGKPLQAVLPLLDAAAFNGKMNKLSDQIIDAEREAILEYQVILGNKLVEEFSFEVLSSQRLSDLEGYQEVKNMFHQKESLLTENDNYPILIIGERDVVPFLFNKGKYIQYLTGDIDYSRVLLDICKKLELGGIAINVIHLNVQGVSTFGVAANARLNSSIFLFNDNGKLVGHTDAFSKINGIRGKEIADYQNLLDMYGELTSNALKDMKSND
ncbi:hypothetical protein [uncultured Arcticibacterium sp.]|uniref:hypothetical protein n=1 Tax=uncultured Arcticibacterium sp. TaxID=2173042 RepID=UPI0030F4D19F